MGRDMSGQLFLPRASLRHLYVLCSRASAQGRQGRGGEERPTGYLGKEITVSTWSPRGCDVVSRSVSVSPPLGEGRGEKKTLDPTQLSITKMLPVGDARPVHLIKSYRIVSFCVVLHRIALPCLVSSMSSQVRPSHGHGPRPMDSSGVKRVCVCGVMQLRDSEDVQSRSLARTGQTHSRCLSVLCMRPRQVLRLLRWTGGRFLRPPACPREGRG